MNLLKLTFKQVWSQRNLLFYYYFILTLYSLILVLIASSILSKGDLNSLIISDYFKTFDTSLLFDYFKNNAEKIRRISIFIFPAILIFYAFKLFFTGGLVNAFKTKKFDKKEFLFFSKKLFLPNLILTLFFLLVIIVCVVVVVLTFSALLINLPNLTDKSAFFRVVIPVSIGFIFLLYVSVGVLLSKILVYEYPQFGVTSVFFKSFSLINRYKNFLKYALIIQLTFLIVSYIIGKLFDLQSPPILAFLLNQLIIIAWIFAQFWSLNTSQTYLNLLQKENFED